MKTDFKALKIDIQDAIAILRIENPPVNQLSANLREELDAAFASAFGDPGVQAVVVTGVGRNFLAGADISEIQGMHDAAGLFEKVMAFNALYDRIELGPKAVVAAINGPALGGGLELAMACHYRVAAQGIDVGQPEVQLGLIPGAGGTQRLPRLCGLPEALVMITGGRPVKAEKARAMGILDDVVPPAALMDAALDAARRFVSGSDLHRDRITRRRKDRLPEEEEKSRVIATAKKAALQKAGPIAAPLKAIEAMEKGLSEDFDGDIRREAEFFSQCAVSDAAQNFIRLFLNSRAAGRLPRIRHVTPADVKTVAILGLGVMGSGIAHILLQLGYKAILWDVNETALQKGRHALLKTFDYLIKKGKMDGPDLERLMAHNALATTDLQDVAPSDLVIEAVLENMEIKKSIWRQVEGVCSPKAVFATNTSALPITDLATALRDPSRMLGMHFFNPAERMQLLEIVNAGATSDQTLATAVGFARKIRKIPVVVNDGPGFYVSRQLNAFMGECNFMLEEGLPMESIDRALMEMGMPMGPFLLHDLTGIDVGYHVARNFEQAFGPRWRVCALHEQIYNTGCYGRKTGSGYYDYSNPSAPVPNEAVMDVIQSHRRNGHPQGSDATFQEIVDRMLARGINEAAYMMDEGICDRPADMDLAMVYGCGYPPHRGGILRDADAWGIERVYAQVKALEEQHGIRFKPSKRLKKMAESGQRFYAD